MEMRSQPGTVGAAGIESVKAPSQEGTWYVYEGRQGGLCS